VLDKLYPTYSKFNYIYSYTFCIAKKALNALKSSGKSSSDAWYLDIPASNGGGSYRNVTKKNTEIYFFFVKDKFTDVLQPFVIPDSHSYALKSFITSVA
jgi:hypothetical protein